ncbi:MAG: hypothetical protein CSB55_06085 [Candidatus Cloacimonadota bacterium]|nr:MAG: hypothetical protein CSB55_06085 [Candidatus Cloacimonadota bacterium]
MTVFRLIQLIRPFNCLLSLVAVFFGAFYNRQIYFDFRLLSAGIAAFLIAAGGNAINDFFDIEIDVINCPDRILPSGKISPKTAYIFAVFLFVSGGIASFFIGNFLSVATAYFNALMLFKYSQKWKKLFLVGNLAVAYLSASTFIFGGLASGNVKNATGIAVFAFLISLLREIIKDMEDIKGDSKLSARTMPCILGLETSAKTAFMPTLSTGGLIAYLTGSGIFSLLKGIVFAIAVFIPLLFMNIKILNRRESLFLHKCSSFIKLTMLLVLALYWLIN